MLLHEERRRRAAARQVDAIREAVRAVVPTPPTPNPAPTISLAVVKETGGTRRRR